LSIPYIVLNSAKQICVQSLQVLPLKNPVFSFIVPVIGLQTQENTDDNNQYIDTSREPVLLSQCTGQASEKHLRSPRFGQP